LDYNTHYEDERHCVNILLVEDQQRLAQALAAILTEEGHHVDVVGDGQSGLDYALSAQQTGTPYDALVLDVMLPILDGFSVARELRRSGSDMPIIMLTARDTLQDKIEGLDAGADDYLTKPFQPAELLARLRALTRRSGTVHVETIVLGNTSLNLQNADLVIIDAGNTSGNSGLEAVAATSDQRLPLQSSSNELSVHLSQREFELCQMFMMSPGQTLTKSNILARVWGLNNDADENSVEAYVSFLRKKLIYLGSTLSIVTVRGMGYRLEVGGPHAG
jgi:DNA-binding response OmpR family regulator